jgi:tRNA1(Val) A37 N6-methylase TrmN6
MELRRCSQWRRYYRVSGRPSSFSVTVHLIILLGVQGFDFTTVPPSSLVVDVGGGIGAVAQMVLQKNSKLKAIVQDRQEVCEQGIAVRV